MSEQLRTTYHREVRRLRQTGAAAAWCLLLLRFVDVQAGASASLPAPKESQPAPAPQRYQQLDPLLSFPLPNTLSSQIASFLVGARDGATRGAVWMKHTKKQMAMWCTCLILHACEA